MGLQYVYKEIVETSKETGKPEQNILTSGRMKELPIAWIAKMKQAIKHVDMDQIDVLISQLRLKDAALGDTIQHWIDQFEYEKVLSWL